MATLNAQDQADFEAIVAAQPLHDVSRPSISLIVPTRNEAANIMPLLERCRRTLAGVPCEVIFVDDSDDATEATIRDARVAIIDPMFDVWSLHREPDLRDGGLGGAVVAGLKLARGRWVCVLDGDLQHPPEVIRMLMDKARDDDSDLVIASRYCAGGDGGGLSSPLRSVGSKFAGRIATTMFSRALDGITDPMSGFFLFRRDGGRPRDASARGVQGAPRDRRADPGPAHLRGRVPLRTPARKATQGVGRGGDPLPAPRGARCAPPQPRGRPRPARCTTTTSTGSSAIESEGVLPELEWFCVRALDRPADITVRIGHLPSTPPKPGRSSSGPRHLRYREIRRKPRLRRRPHRHARSRRGDSQPRSSRGRRTCSTRTSSSRSCGGASSSGATR